MNIANQKPVLLSSQFSPNAGNVYDPKADIDKILIDPLFEPLNAAAPVDIQDDQNNTVTKDDIYNHVLNCTSDIMNASSEDWLCKLYRASMIYVPQNEPFSFRELFAVQAGIKEKIPLPSDRVRYTSLDISESAKLFLSGHGSSENLFANFAFTLRLPLLGFYCKTNQVYEDFKAFVASQHSVLSSTLSANVNKMFQDFQATSVKQDLFEDIMLREDDAHGNDPLSFPRLLHRFAMDFAAQSAPDDFGVMPFDTFELFCPKNIVFINVENHAHATTRKISNEWDLVKKSLDLPVKIIPTNRLQKMTAVARNIQRQAAQAAINAQKTAHQAHRIISLKFKKTRPSTVDTTKAIMSLMNRMTSSSRTMNTYTLTRHTLSKPNRRDPDNYNMAGTSVSTKYRPDLHLYIDTSGSITEEDYEQTVKSCIAMARKFQIDMYVNFFSHTMTQTYRLKVKNKTAKEIYRQFQNLPKVGGGTDYANVWNYITRFPSRQKELSIMITDFEYTAPSRFIEHPKNLYYVPCSTISWSYLLSCAQTFCRTTQHNDPAIRRRLLF